MVFACPTCHPDDAAQHLISARLLVPVVDPTPGRSRHFVGRVIHQAAFSAFVGPAIVRPLPSLVRVTPFLRQGHPNLAFQDPITNRVN
jgi:hypothetical protein